jgi:hypothetical protein
MGKKVEENGARRRQRRSFTPEFKAEIIALVRRCERSLPAIFPELLSQDGWDVDGRLYKGRDEFGAAVVRAASMVKTPAA